MAAGAALVAMAVLFCVMQLLCSGTPELRNFARKGEVGAVFCRTRHGILPVKYGQYFSHLTLC